MNEEKIIHIPTWRYHRTEEARIVRSLDELAELGPDWVDNPRVFEDEDAAAAEAAALAATAPAPAAEPEPEPEVIEAAELPEEKPKKTTKKK
jgi:hypothetical protein